MMLGAIAGDIIGSRWEFSKNARRKNFAFFSKDCRFTDDTVLTLAIADSLMNGGEYVDQIYKYARHYIDRGFSRTFRGWINGGTKEPYGSTGNGSAMRVSPVSYYFKKEKDVLEHAEKTASVSHNSPEGIRGAQAVALSVWLARHGVSKKEIKRRVENLTGYKLGISLRRYRHDPKTILDATCEGSIPHSIRAFLESTSFEDAIRKGIFVGGDSDTIASVAGVIAEAYYGGVPKGYHPEIYRHLTRDLADVTTKFMIEHVDSKFVEPKVKTLDEQNVLMPDLSEQDDPSDPVFTNFDEDPMFDELDTILAEDSQSLTN